MSIWSVCSEVFPAVLDSELGVDVVEWSRITSHVLVHVDLSPLGGVRHIWEGGSVVSLVLEGLGGTIIEPIGVAAGERTADSMYVVGSPIAKSEFATLRAKLPLVGKVLDVSGLLFIVELHMFVFLNPLLEVTWDSRE